jgi:hypothetical protein
MQGGRGWGGDFAVDDFAHRIAGSSGDDTPAAGRRLLLIHRRHDVTGWSDRPVCLLKPAAVAVRFTVQDVLIENRRSTATRGSHVCLDHRRRRYSDRGGRPTRYQVQRNWRCGEEGAFTAQTRL